MHFAGWTARLVGARWRSLEVVEVNEQAEAGAHLVSLGQMCPAPLVDIAGSEVVFEVATLHVPRIALDAGFTLSRMRRRVARGFPKGRKRQGARERS
jgi:hypothetical protein